MKDNLIRIVVALLLVAAVAWLVDATEWAPTESRTPARGEAATNAFYATQKLLRELGGTVVKRPGLDQMPPAQARLLLASRHWDLFPDRAARLREWVEQGGQLLIPGSMVGHESLKDWLPLDSRIVKADPKAEPAPKSSAAAAAKDADCRTLTEPDSSPASYAGLRNFRFCGVHAGSEYVSKDGKRMPLWSMQGPRGAEMLRMPMGKGSVTVIGSWSVLTNGNLLRADNPLLVAAALEARAGAEYWFVVEESREPFVRWLWHNGQAAILLGLLALGVALWRAGVRFGPLIASIGTQRRSMAEQVRGTAEFLHMHGGDALHAAQVRALDESARRQLRRHAQGDAGQRTAAIAQATGLDARALSQAMASRKRGPGALAADLELLETARRRLDANAIPHAPTSP
ncbi:MULTISPECIES: DUF4350 domain-containing protein [unclassified Variovorax]|uniref:DUF4350 domain-containing protein n=1 Tax=unclassified Variovorax TaxID=663243 RepID=UPI001BD5C68D|nr:MULTISPECIES: DUF4350 domain-containing protein [unclassified Variovorax]